MTHARAVTLFLCLLGTLSGCRPASAGSETAELAAREQRLATRLANSGTGPVARWVLPKDLAEVSGLAVTADGRILAHNDEQGRVYVIDPRRGALLKRFAIGTNAAEARADFEGITVANGKVYMVASNGTIYEFVEGEDGERVRYSLHDTGLGKECEFEGVAFDSSSGSLLLPCKTVGTRTLRNELVIYRWNLQQTASPRLSMLTIPLRRLIGSNSWKTLHPSDITVDPATGNYVLVASIEKGLLEITPSGEVVRSVALPGKHTQAEGLAITPGGILIVSDEASNGSATITLYRWPLPAATTGSP